ncbi:MAG TPA: L-serine ammonia-lyase [Candidatus Obscuribacterales bacterium]
MNPTRADHIGPLDMFKIGIGPSSSHTVGPMIAALDFRTETLEKNLNKETAVSSDWKITVELFGSLSATGRGHATDGAVCAGLLGLNPKSAEPADIWEAMPALTRSPFITINNTPIRFNPSEDIAWQGWLMDGNALPHPNTVRFRLVQADKVVAEEVILSVGGGFIEHVDPHTGQRKPPLAPDETKPLPYPYNSAQEFVEQCVKSGMPPWQIVIENQKALGMNEADLRERLGNVLKTFALCIERGLSAEGILPGGLNVKRRAKKLYEQLKAGKTTAWSGSDLRPSVYAMAVNEENAAGGRVVTAPTNGSSGLIPAVWKTLAESHNLSDETLQNGLIVASVIGALVKTHASISGAEVGCQGEVGTSCAMAAAGAVAMLGGTPYQIEQAAEIGIEHHLGMTCDPMMGLVQVPCIERNAMGAVKALNAAALSLASDGQHLVSLDKALLVMKQTGLDMNQKYKETATGGLALG